jgi:hypothetical protein
LERVTRGYAVIACVPDTVVVGVVLAWVEGARAVVVLGVPVVAVGIARRIARTDVVDLAVPDVAPAVACVPTVGA